MNPSSSELVRVQEIGGMFHAGELCREDTLAAVIDVILERLQCSRVSLWRFEGTPGNLMLLCFAARRRGEALVNVERRLLEPEYRAYFDGLIRSGVYVADDAMADPALQPMREKYLLPNRVHSMLDAAFMVNGRAYGTVCCERTDAIRHWRADEIAALRAIVAKLAMMVASADPELLWALPSRSMAPAAAPAPPGAPDERRR